MNVFQDNSLGVDNPQSREEDEELEEEKRRQEELAHLLATEIHAFNYDESTMNSSVTSAEGVDANYPDANTVKNKLKYDDSNKTLLDVSTIGQSYKDVNQQDQLKVLYEVRVREINSLRDEFNKFKEEKAKEMNVLKNKVTLSEAEIRHLQVTLSNSESLLVEHKGNIKNLKQTVISRDDEIKNLKKILEQQNLEICTYQSTVNELQLKLADNNPFSAGSRKFNSEELQRAHQDQIIKLETLLQEQTKRAQILEKEKCRIEEDLKKIIRDKKEIEEENNLTIMGLSKKLQSTQQQCKDLFLLGEAIKKESDHFKDRLQQLETDKFDLCKEDFHMNKMDKETMMVQLEKLKRMLLDKDTELNTFKAKLKFYDSDLHELFEYRQLLAKMYSCEIKSCNNGEHEELLIFMQRQLQSYEQAVEDRNNQIVSLNLVNKELQEKIEEMIQQTRTDILNISQKYSLPQLETMSKELKNAEDTINTLKEQLSEKEDLVNKLKKGSQTAKEKKNFEEIKQELKKREEEKNQMLKEIEEFKKAELQLTEENGKVKTQLQKICLQLGLSEADIFESDGDVQFSSLKAKYGQIHDQLQHVLAHLENVHSKRANFNIIFKLKKQVQNYLGLLSNQKLEQKQIQEKLEQWDNLLSDFVESLKHSENFEQVNAQELDQKEKIEELANAKTMLEGEKFALEYQLKCRNLELEEAKKEITALTENGNVLIKGTENSALTIQKLNDQINNLKKCLQIAEENKLEVEKQLENTQKQLNEAKQETIDLHKKVSEVHDNAVRENLFKELKDVENVLEKKSDDVSSSDTFQKCLQAHILKAEISLRGHLQEDNIKKMQRIEHQYRNVLAEKSDMYNKEKEKWKRQEANYRKQFAAVLDECGKKMEELEKENIALVGRINGIVQEYKLFRSNAISSLEKYNKMVTDCKNSMGNLNAQWGKIFDYYAHHVAKIQNPQQKTVKNILKTINLKQTEVNLIENAFNEKIKKLKERRMKAHPTFGTQNGR